MFRPAQEDLTKPCCGDVENRKKRFVIQRRGAGRSPAKKTCRMFVLPLALGREERM
jgi:hypothetical protein